MKIKLPCGSSTKVSPEDYEYLIKFKWWKNKKTGYVARTFGGRINKKHIYMHREITKCPADLTVDHINGIKTDNTRENLQIITFKQNQFGKKTKNSSSKYRGVGKVKHNKTNTWVAKGTCTTKNKTINIGYFKTEKEAARASDKFIIFHHGKLAKTNFNYKYSQSNSGGCCK